MAPYGPARLLSRPRYAGAGRGTAVRAIFSLRPVQGGRVIVARGPGATTNLEDATLADLRSDGKRNLEARATEGGCADCNPAVVKDDDLLHESEAEARSVALRGEERPEHPLARRRRDAGAAVVDRDPHDLLPGVD